MKPDSAHYAVATIDPPAIVYTGIHVADAARALKGRAVSGTGETAAEAEADALEKAIAVGRITK